MRQSPNRTGSRYLATPKNLHVFPVGLIRLPNIRGTYQKISKKFTFKIRSEIYRQAGFLVTVRGLKLSSNGHPGCGFVFRFTLVSFQSIFF
jgi:hypothetical protein